MLFKKKKEPVIKVSAVVVAAGGSTRMQGYDKQLLRIDGIPVIARSVGALSSCPRISEIVIVCRREQIAEYYDIVRYFEFDKVSSVVAGREKRQDSVFAGIDACSKDARFFAIHDGARPLVSPADIELCIDAAIMTGAAALAAPVVDTIKICDENKNVVSTPERSGLWAVHTPQIFDTALYISAMTVAKSKNKDYTDDCQLFENSGKKVRLVPESHDNIKITKPEDIAIAEAILKIRQEGCEQWLTYE